MIAPAERRLVTALFCDMVGSTALAERLDPEVLRAVMADYTGLARAAIERNGGIVAAFQGDGAVGLFGLAAVDEDDAVHAALAGLDLLASLPGAAEAAAQGVALQGRVGIESGEVLGEIALAATGALGGDVLNTAARLQAAAEPGTVVAGEAAIRLLQGRAELRFLAPLTLKGKAEPVACAVVLSVEVGPRRLFHVAVRWPEVAPRIARTSTGVRGRRQSSGACDDPRRTRDREVAPARRVRVGHPGNDRPAGLRSGGGGGSQPRAGHRSRARGGRGRDLRGGGRATG